MPKKRPQPELHRLRDDVVYDDISLAPVLNVSQTTIKHYRLSGRLNFSQEGKGKVFIRKEDVIRFLENGKKMKAWFLFLCTNQFLGSLDFL